MNERSHDHDKLFEFLGELWAEDHFIWNPVLCDKGIRGSFVGLGDAALPVNDRE